MNGDGIALAAIALAATAMGGMIWIVKYLATTLSVDLKEHTKAAIAQTAASKEVLTFMVNLNGKLTTAAQKTAKESEKA